MVNHDYDPPLSFACSFEALPKRQTSKRFDLETAILLLCFWVKFPLKTLQTLHLTNQESLA